MKQRKWFFFDPRLPVVLALLLALAGCQGSSSGTQDQVATLNAETAQKLQQLLDQKVAQHKIPGAVMAVGLPGTQTWVGVSGVSNLSDNKPITAQDKFRIGSNTKTFTAMAILQLAQEGALGLDDSLAKWLPGIMPNYAGASNSITIRQMLQHTSGIFSFTEDGNWGNNFLTNPLYRYAPSDLIAIANSHPAYFAPGAGFKYSNTNYVLLALIIEKATGRAFEEEIRRRFILPLGLANTNVPFMGDSLISGNFSHGYNNYQGQMFDYTVLDPSSTWSSGNMLSTAEDLTKWVRAVGRGDLLNEEFKKEQFTFVDMVPWENLKYGLGLVSEPANALYGHQGGIVGYSSQMYYVKDRDATIVFLYNRTFPSDIHDYSVVATYDALAILFPDKMVVRPAETKRFAGVPAGIPGHLSEY